MNDDRLAQVRSRLEKLPTEHLHNLHGMWQMYNDVLCYCVPYQWRRFTNNCVEKLLPNRRVFISV